MPKIHQPVPWHQIVRLKEELRTGERSLAQFAADLHEVTLAQGRRPIYEDPEKFFALTCPTRALRDLVKDLAARLSGNNDKAVRQLELTCGSGKTHTLIALYHLFRNPEGLPVLPAVRELRAHAGGDLPRAVVAALCFDKIDVERGIEEVQAPDGETRTLRHPWSVLAFQLAGPEGLRLIHADGEDEERETPPAEPLLRKLIENPGVQCLATLILVDEVLMYAREKAEIDPVWRNRIVDFFQSLTLAVVKADRAAIVASLRAADPHKQRGEVGQRLVSDLFDVFLRQHAEGVQPVRKEDVAEVLRRRLFEPDDIRNRGALRARASGVVRGLAGLDEATAGTGSATVDRFRASFPFHPDLADAFYSRWTQLEGFQRARGILRTLATALREAERWDTAPLVGPSALLTAPGGKGISRALHELASVAASETAQGSDTAWAPVLESELDKAREIQDGIPALQAGREVEQAVIAVFLHSQPIGHRASTPELVRLVGSAAPDAIELGKGLRRWREISWFLDDEDTPPGTGGAGGTKRGGTETGATLPASWRLGNRPNLRQMHEEACRQRVSGEAVEARLEEAIRSVKALVEGASGAGVTPHLLPASPRDVGDDGGFRYAVLGPGAASDSGKASPTARRFLDEVAGTDRPRVHRNALVLAVPSRHGLEAVRVDVRAVLGWEDVRGRLSGCDLEVIHAERIRHRLDHARARIPGAIRQAYSVVVTVNESNDAHAFKLGAGTGALFASIKNDERARIRETPVDAEALLPGGPYDLWCDDDDARRVKDLAGAFARYPRLPKVLNPRVILDTVLQGVERGLFVARFARSDRSFRTWWREPVDAESRTHPELEIVLPEHAELGRLSEELLAPGALPGLWNEDPETGVTLRDVTDYFAGGRSVRIPMDGFDEVRTIPRCGEEVIREAVERAVMRGTVWLINGPASVWKDPIPYGVYEEDAVLRPRPDPVAAQELLDDALPGAWRDGTANGITLAQALSRSRGRRLPWGLVRQGIKAGVESRCLEVAEDSGPVSCMYDEAGSLRLNRIAPGAGSEERPAPTRRSAVLEGCQVQDLADLIPELLSVSAGNNLRFHVRATLGADAPNEIREVLDAMLAEVSPDLKT